MARTGRGIPARAPVNLSIKGMAPILLQAPVSKRKYLLLEVETDAGITGIGDSTLAENIEGVRAALYRLEALLVGRDPLAGAELWQVLAAETATLDATSRAALGGVDMALWDIRGKVLGVPVYQLSGGPTRAKARACVPLSGASTEELVACARRQHQKGVRVFRFSPPAPPYLDADPKHIRDIRRTLEQLRQAVPGGDFVVDCQGKFSLTNAALLARELEPLHPLWLDEPCPRGLENSLRSVAQETVVPLAAGRWGRNLGEFLSWVSEQALDVMRPDIIASGGFTPVRKIGHLAESHYAAVAPFNDGSVVATAAALQFAASVSNFYIQETPWPAAEEDREMRGELLAQPLEVFQDGYLPLPSGPGLGIELRRDRLEKYRCDRRCNQEEKSKP